MKPMHVWVHSTATSILSLKGSHIQSCWIILHTAYCIIPRYLQTRQADICCEGQCLGRIPVAKPGAVARRTRKPLSPWFWMFRFKYCLWKVLWSNGVNKEIPPTTPGNTTHETWGYPKMHHVGLLKLEGLQHPHNTDACQSGSGQSPTTRTLWPQKVEAVTSKAWALRKSVVLQRFCFKSEPRSGWWQSGWNGVPYYLQTMIDKFSQQTDVNHSKHSKYCTPGRQ